ncbi:hypothetical protein YTPLAS73_09620 [Nitrosarchaeum sp.]|nr:hypothetical protein YTPLAS73_09620 [Nitrosarchaeum sp.]
MSQSSLPPFLKWGDYKSKDAKSPDTIQVVVVDPESFETQYDWNVLVTLDMMDVNIPLKAKSTNKILYRQYNKLLHSGKIQSGTVLQIKTWLRQSSKNPEKELRDFEVKPL